MVEEVRPQPDTGAPNSLGRAPHVVVVGGGMSGLSAAIELAGRGVRVTLLEGASAAGGKGAGWREVEESAASYPVDHAAQQWHAGYANFFDLLGRVGIAGNLIESPEPHLTIHRGGVVEGQTFSDLPAPFHALRMLRGLHSLGLRGKLSALRAGLEIAAFDPEEDYRRLDLIDFGTWLRGTGASARAVSAIFEPPLRADLLLPLEHLSAAAGIATLWHRLRHRDGWRSYWLRGNMKDYLWEPLATHFTRHGGELRLNSRVVGLRLKDGRVESLLVRSGGQDDGGPPSSLAADYVVLAVDVESCKELVQASLNEYPFFNSLFNLGSTDVLVTRTWLQGDLRLPFHAALQGFRLVDSFTDLTRIQPELYRPNTTVVETRSYVSQPWMQAPESSVRELVMRDLCEAVPALELSRLLKMKVLRRYQFFTAFGLGFETFRPATRTPIANLLLAGDWVGTPERAVLMENAVLTGRYAAAAVLEAQGLGAVPIIESPASDQPVAAIGRAAKALRATKRGLYRLIGYRQIGEGERV